MTAIQQQAIQLIQRLPDAKIQAIITLATDELNLISFQQSDNNTKKRKAFANLEALDLNIPSDFDAEEELAKAIGDKYGITD